MNSQKLRQDLIRTGTIICKLTIEMAFPKHRAFPIPDQILSARAQALSHPARLSILRLLDKRDFYVKDLTRLLPLSQPAVSSHLEILRRVGLVSVAIEGRWNSYSLERCVVDELIWEILEFYEGFVGEARL